jgi:hypothetical protein
MHTLLRRRPDRCSTPIATLTAGALVFLLVLGSAGGLASVFATPALAQAAPTTAASPGQTTVAPSSANETNAPTNAEVQAAKDRDRHRTGTIAFYVMTTFLILAGGGLFIRTSRRAKRLPPHEGVPR